MAGAPLPICRAFSASDIRLIRSLTRSGSRLRRIQPQRRAGNLRNFVRRSIRAVHQIRCANINHRRARDGILHFQCAHAGHTAGGAECHLNRPGNHVRLMLHHAGDELHLVRGAIARVHGDAPGQRLVAGSDVKHARARVRAVIGNVFHHACGDDVSAFRQTGDGGGKLRAVDAVAIITFQASGRAVEGDPARDATMGEIAAEADFLLAGRARFLGGKEGGRESPPHPSNSTVDLTNDFILWMGWILTQRL